MNPSSPPGSFCLPDVTSEGSPFLGLVLCSIAKSSCPTSGQFHQLPSLAACPELPATSLCSEQPAKHLFQVCRDCSPWTSRVPVTQPLSLTFKALHGMVPSMSLVLPACGPCPQKPFCTAALTSLRMHCSLQHPVRHALSSPSSFHPLGLGHPPGLPSCPPACGRMSVLPAAAAPSADPLCSPWRGMGACCFLCHRPIPSL